MSLRLTEEEFRDLKAKRAPAPGPEKKQLKFGNHKTELDGFTFDSKKEASRYLILKMWQQSGQITELEPQKVIPLEVNGVLIANYVSDFTYRLKGERVIEDVKSGPTRRVLHYVMKKKLVKALYGIDIQEV